MVHISKKVIKLVILQLSTFLYLIVFYLLLGIVTWHLSFNLTVISNSPWIQASCILKPSQSFCSTRS